MAKNFDFDFLSPILLDFSPDRLLMYKFYSALLDSIYLQM